MEANHSPYRPLISNDNFHNDSPILQGKSCSHMDIQVNPGNLVCFAGSVYWFSWHQNVKYVCRFLREVQIKSPFCVSTVKLDQYGVFFLHL